MQRVKERDREQKYGVWKVKKESKGRKKQRFIERKRKKKSIERNWHHPRKGVTLAIGIENIKLCKRILSLYFNTIWEKKTIWC